MQVYDLQALCALINKALGQPQWRQKYPSARCKLSSGNLRNRNTELCMPAVWRGGDNPESVRISRTGLWYDFPARNGGNLGQLFHALGFRDEAEILALPVVGTFSEEAAFLEDEDKRAFAQHVWYDALPLADAIRAGSPLADVARRYLLARDLPDSAWQNVVRLCRVLPNEESPGGAILLVPLYDPTPPFRRISGMQRIYLTAAGQKMTGEQKAKRMLGLHKLGEGRFSGILIPADRRRCERNLVTLAICEGFETGLGIHSGTGFAVYAMLDTAGVEGVCIDYLRHLRPARIVLAGDNDDPKPDGRIPGWEAIRALSRRLQVAGIAHELALPPRNVGGDKGADWLDAWQYYGPGLARVMEAAIRHYHKYLRKTVRH